MIGLLIQLIVVLLFLGIIWWIATLIAGAMSLPPMVLTLVQVLLVLIFLVWLLGALGVVGGTPGWRLCPPCR